MLESSSTRASAIHHSLDFVDVEIPMVERTVVFDGERRLFVAHRCTRHDVDLSVSFDTILTAHFPYS